MRLEQPENDMEFLFSAALRKSGSIEDAEDLTQEVLLAALRHPGEIANRKAWFSAVLSHKYYDLLRQKYKLPTVSIDLMPEEAEPADDPADSDRPDAAAVRREVAHLAEKYREVIVRHYLHGEKVQQIAEQMGLPGGTVLSRLAAGREQMKKGLDVMDAYEKHSYQPERLDVSCNGQEGLHGEPWSLVADDMMKQNILIAAYEKPLTCVEIARGLGIPTAYIERAVRDLLSSQLMAQTGTRVFTDFLITSPEQMLRVLDGQIAFAQRHYTAIWNCIREANAALERLGWYSAMPAAWQRKCAYYFLRMSFRPPCIPPCAGWCQRKKTFRTAPAAADGSRRAAVIRRILILPSIVSGTTPMAASGARSTRRVWAKVDLSACLRHAARFEPV